MYDLDSRRPQWRSRAERASQATYTVWLQYYSDMEVRHLARASTMGDNINDWAGPIMAALLMETAGDHWHPPGCAC